MPGVPQDALSQAKKSLRSMFRKKSAQADAEDVATTHSSAAAGPPPSYPAMTTVPAHTTRALPTAPPPPPAVPAPPPPKAAHAGYLPNDIKTTEPQHGEETPTTPSLPPTQEDSKQSLDVKIESEEPEKHVHLLHESDTTPNVVVTPSPDAGDGSTNGPGGTEDTAEETPMANIEAHERSVEQHTSTAGHASDATEPAARATSAEESEAPDPTIRPPSPEVMMSATSGPLEDQPVFA